MLWVVGGRGEESRWWRKQQQHSLEGSRSRGTSRRQGRRQGREGDVGRGRREVLVWCGVGALTLSWMPSSADGVIRLCTIICEISRKILLAAMMPGCRRVGSGGGAPGVAYGNATRQYRSAVVKPSRGRPSLALFSLPVLYGRRC